jgi:hypothetical protein
VRRAAWRVAAAVVPAYPRLPGGVKSPALEPVMRDRRLVDVTIILLIGIVLMALVIYLAPKNPYCFRDIRSAADKVLRDSVTVAECLKDGPLEESSPAPR